MRTVITVCPLDCFDVCSMVTSIEKGKVVGVSGNKVDPITKGYICSKGKAHLDRLYHPNRLLKPLLKVDGKWQEISYEKAINTIVDKMKQYIGEYGNQSIMNYNDCGYSGMGKSVEDMFFNHLGGITTYHGTLCWGAGTKAQIYDFGDRKGHSPEDLKNSKTVILWGRNPAENNIHLVEHLKAAKDNGAKIIVVDPVNTKTARFADQHIRVKCGCDGYLAMAIAHIIIKENWIDEGFIESHVKGYEIYREYVLKQDLEKLSTKSGVSINTIKELAKDYSKNTPSAIWIGYGMQRYENGGNNVRAIDALGAITGSIGIKGGGVTYTHKSITKYIKGPLEESEKYAVKKRTFSKAKFAEFVLKEYSPEIKMLFVTRANPMTQLPDINMVKKAFNKIEFKVVIDMFMTDSAREADLVLPATSIFEENDFISSSMYNPYLQYSEKAVDPPRGMIGEYELFRKLAKRLDLREYPDVDIDTFFEMQLKSLCKKLGKTYIQSKNENLKMPDIDVPYKDLLFDTPSGKIELVSELAIKDGVAPHGVLLDNKSGTEKYNLRLLTIRSPFSINSQHFMEKLDKPVVYINKETAKANSVLDIKSCIVKSQYGELEVKLKIDEALPNGTIKINQGWWHHSGCVNVLTGSKLTDMGDQAAYYDTFVGVRRLEE